MKLLILLACSIGLQAQILTGVFAGNFGSAGGNVAQPTDSPGQGTYMTSQTVTLSDSTSGATICYTVDNSTPAATTPGTCSHGSTYSSGFSVATTTTVKAIGTKSGLTNSTQLTSVYTITGGVTLLSESQQGGNGTFSTPAIDSSGASIWFGAAVAFSAMPTVAPTANISSTPSNTIIGPANALTYGNQGGSYFAGLFFVPPTVTTSATHTMTCTSCTGLFPTIWQAAFSGTTMSYQGSWSIGTTYAADDVVVDPIDLFPYMSIAGGNIANSPHTSPSQWRVMMALAGSSSTTTQQAGALTPLHNNALIVSLAVTGTGTGTLTVDSSFVSIGTDATGSGFQSGAFAYLHQGTAGAINPTWTISASANALLVINMWVNGT